MSARKYAPPVDSGAVDDSTSSPEELAESLLARALAGGDRASVEARIEALADHASVVVRRAAAVALGHVARVHGAVDRALAQRVLAKLAADPQTRAAASDARDDIATFAQAPK